jgi:subtilisin family serine protease
LNGPISTAGAEELAAAIIETIGAGARLLNISASLLQPLSPGERALQQALNHAAQRGVITVAAGGNHGTVSSSVITRHSWIIPDAGCDARGRSTSESNLGHSIGTRGVNAPSVSITSLGADGQPRLFSGVSAATPFVTGAIALIWSEFLGARAADVKLA